MTIVCLRFSPTFLAMMRAAVSAPPPATKPTTSVSVFCGSSWAVARPAASQRVRNASAVFIGLLPARVPSSAGCEFRRVSPAVASTGLASRPKRYDDRIALQEIEP